MTMRAEPDQSSVVAILEVTGPTGVGTVWSVTFGLPGNWTRYRPSGDVYSGLIAPPHPAATIASKPRATIRPRIVSPLRQHAGLTTAGLTFRTAPSSLAAPADRRKT
jgi:hypothetical protein